LIDLKPNYGVRIIFAGTPPFAEKALRAIHAAGFDIALVLTQPDRPAGRGKALRASAVKSAANELGIEIFQPATLKTDDAQQKLKAVDAHVMVVAAYGLILPKAVLEIPQSGCLNIHASLLPRWRGATPIQRAIQAGDSVTGITLMQMDVGLDTGPMISQQIVPIAKTDSAAVVHNRLADLGALMIVETLNHLKISKLESITQPTAGVTYAAKLEKSEAWIDWTLDAPTIAAQIRAFDPVPGCTACVQSEPDQVLKIWRAEVFRSNNDSDSQERQIGRIYVDEKSKVLVSCGQGAVELLELQRPGGKRMSANQWFIGQAAVGKKKEWLFLLSQPVHE
jgi:methionyl-tRNA formyltransferase